MRMAIEKFPYKNGDAIDRGIYYRLPKFLFDYQSFSKLSIEAKVLYARFLELVEISSKNGWYDEDGILYIKFTIKKVQEFFDCSVHKARDIFKELGEEGVGLITRIEQGRGQPSIIYVHKFIPEDSDLKGVHTQKVRTEKDNESSQKDNGSSQKNIVYYSKSTPNKNNTNKVIYNTFNNTNPYNYSMDEYEKKYTDGGGSL